MPKDEGHPNDPMELTGVALPASPGALDEMAWAIAEEFLRMGYSPEQVLEMFRNPFYRGPHQVYRARGESAVRTIIREAARKWVRCAGGPAAAAVTGGYQEVTR